MGHRRSYRRGLSLFEVALALGIFMMSLAALGHLVSSGSRAAIDGQRQTEAIIRCESKLAEVVAGVAPMKAVENVPFDDNADWRWSLDVRKASIPNLLEIELSVSRGDHSSASSYSLRRYVRDADWFVTERTKEGIQIQSRRTVISAEPDPSETSKRGDTDR